MTLMAGKDEEVASPVDRLDNTSEAFGINVSTEKTKLMTSNTNGISFHIRINGEKLDEVNSFKYIWAQSSKIKVPMSRIARTTAALGRLKTIWNDKHLSLTSKIKRMRSYIPWFSQYCCTLSKPGHWQRTFWRNCSRACQDNFTGNSARKVKKRTTKEALGE